jgi:hypothetical protein
LTKCQHYLKPWVKKRFEHLKVVGAADGAVKEVKPKNSIGGSCAPGQKVVVVYRGTSIICRILELSRPNIDYFACY